MKKKASNDNSPAAYRWLLNGLWFTNLLCAFALLLSYLAAYVSPAKVWWLAIFGLAMGPLLFINAAFLFTWLLLRKRRFWLSLIMLLVGIGKILSIYHLNLKSQATEAELRDSDKLKVMSYNVRLFNLYNWFHNKETRAEIFTYLKKEDPDILCIQEFYSSDANDGIFKNDDTLRTILKANAQIEYTLTLRGKDHWGIATYSKYPIIRRKTVRFHGRSRNAFIYADIVKGKDTIRVFNTHLESIRFHWEDYKFIENLGNDEVQQNEISGGLKILKRLKRAYQTRAEQVAAVETAIRQSPYPVIVCGDFNDTPASFTYRIFADFLTDAFRQTGSGFGTTYAGPLPLPSLRIDYIFHDKRLKSYGFQTHQEHLSDHYGISCYIQLP